MAIVYVTPEAKFGAEKFNINPRLDLLCEKLRATDFDSALRLLEIRHPYYYERLDNYRVVFQVRRELEQRVLCVLHIYKKGDKETDTFLKDPASVGKKSLEAAVDPSALRSYVEGQVREKKQQETPAEKEALPDEIRSWLHPFGQADDLDLIVMESPEWVEAMRQKEYSNFWQSYHALVQRAIFGDARGEPVVGLKITEDSEVRRLDGVDKRSIFYAQFAVQSDTEGLDTTQILFLLGLAKDEATKNESQSGVVQSHAWIPTEGDRPSRDTVARRAARAYPAVLVADPEMWLQIQQDDHANLALSGEEAALLSVARHAPPGGMPPPLPVFINGRAGSGKSTLLYLLFSDYVSRAAPEEDAAAGRLIFLTYSEKLLAKAKDTVGRLLRNRHDFLNRRNQRSVSVTDRQLSVWFQPFARFIFGFVPDDDKKRFAPERQIDLRRFKQLFHNSSDLPQDLLSYGMKIPIPKGVTAELSWHVIRTYIKGHSVNGLLSIEDYEEVPPKDRSVSADVFGEVFRTIWNQWYRKLVEDYGFWDSQDLVRCVLDADAVRPTHAVVFCDEAQDFTRIEINFILRLLIYRAYDLGWEQRIRLPFALAGDPFQTLNPTGFRWESVMAAFYDEVRRELDPENRLTVAFRYEPLLFNYRSSGPVVKLGNLITLIRQRLTLRDKEVKPQQSWREDSPGMAVLLLLGRTVSPEDLTVLLRDSVVIVPCEPGEESEYVSRDDHMSKHAGPGQGVTVLSPLSAKGLEFSQVILYGFGDACPEGLLGQEPSDSEAMRLGAEYFLNKLYVACTRATRDVIVVDSLNGNDRLWSKLADMDFRKHSVSDTQDPELWDRYIDPPILFQYGDLTNVEKQDPREVAEQLRRGGSESNNPYVLRQAAELFKRCKDGRAARECIAEALEIEENYPEAGREYESLNRLEDAERSWWRGSCWKELSIFFEKNPGFGDQLRRSVVRVETLPGNVEGALQLIRRVSDVLARGAEPPSYEPQFQSGLVKALQTGLDAIADGRVSEDAHLVMRVLDHFRSLNSRIGQDRLVGALHAMGEYQRVADLLERTGRTKDPRYYEAKAETTIGSDRVEWLHKLKDDRRVVQEYENAGGNRWKDDIRKIVAKSYENLKRFVESGRIYLDVKSYGEAGRVARSAIQSARDDQSRATAYELVDQCAKALLNSSSWRDFEDLSVSMKEVDSESRQFERAQEYIKFLCRAKDWKRASKQASDDMHDERKDTNRADRVMSSPTDDQLLRLQCLIAQEVANLAGPPDTEDSRILTEMLESLLDRVGLQWRKILSKEVVAGAIERTWRDIDVLPRYEKFLRDGDLGPEEEDYFRKRWLKVKNRWLNRGPQNPIRRRELVDQLEKWGMSDSDVKKLPEYPQASSAEQAPIMRRESSYRVDWHSPKCRIKLPLPDGSDKTLTVDVSRGDVDEFGGVEYELGEPVEGRRTLAVVAWGLVDGEIEVGKRLAFTLDGKKHSYLLPTNA